MTEQRTIRDTISVGGSEVLTAWDLGDVWDVGAGRRCIGVRSPTAISGDRGGRKS